MGTINRKIIEMWFGGQGISRKEFAEKVGISYSHLTGIFVNKKKPSLKLVKRIQEVTKLDMDDLLNVPRN